MNRHFWRACDRRGHAGLTLVELLVTIIIAGIAFAAIVPVVVQAMRAGQGDRARALALSVAQDRVEKVRELGYEELTTTNLEDPDFHFGLFGPTSNGPDGTTDRVFDVVYAVTEVPVSLTDTRIAFKKVTVTVDWRGAPYPHRSVSLSTVVYRQSAGPRIVDASLDVTKLDATSKTEIAMTPIRVDASPTYPVVENARAENE
jgi:prepilin-type N-terminal cleavage/methylation domain-containing protein